MSNQNENNKYQQFTGFDFTGCYGYHANQNQIKDFILDTWKCNVERESCGMPRSVVSIWGAAGCSKTAVAKSFSDIEVEYKGKFRKFSVISVPLGQTEEMGDIVGIPNSFVSICKKFTETDDEGKTTEKTKTMKVSAEDSILQYYFSKGWNLVDDSRIEMSYAPPSWVPVDEGPGILIFDDANRASVRILKGIMQLIQDYRTIGWSIPSGWLIVCTGNPDNSSYIVASQDDAMITRMKHITMDPSVEQWAEWARSINLDDRGISFLLKNPELIYPKRNSDGNFQSRTNFRTITDFFLGLGKYASIGEQNKTKFFIDGCSCVDEEFVYMFYLFLTRDYSLALDPIDILENPAKSSAKISEWMNGTEQRIDLVSISMERLMHHICRKDYRPNPLHKSNMVSLLLDANMPKSMAHAMMKRIHKNDDIKDYNKDPRLREMVIQMLRLEGVLQ